MNSRIKKILVRLDENRLDALLVTHQPNISFLTHYESRDSYLLISQKENFFITDFRYFWEASRALKNFRLEKLDNLSVFKLIAKIVDKLNIKNLGFESKYTSFAEYEKLKESLPTKVKLNPTFNFVEYFRLIKDKEEISKLRKSIEITVMGFNFLKKNIRVGMKEIELAAEFEHFIRFKGAKITSFPVIVASGWRSSMPHAFTSQRMFKKDELILIDAGVEFEGYKSDLTRIFILGKISLKIKRTYDIVLEAQRKAIDNIRPGESIKKIDQIARQYITKNGLGSFFGHNLGHGIGLEVHEDPPISSKNTSPLISGMVFTIEPAVYLPRNFGIRIEDMILVTPEGCEILSVNLDKSA